MLLKATGPRAFCLGAELGLLSSCSCCFCCCFLLNSPEASLASMPKVEDAPFADIICSCISW